MNPLANLHRIFPLLYLTKMNHNDRKEIAEDIEFIINFIKMTFVENYFHRAFQMGFFLPYLQVARSAGKSTFPAAVAGQSAYGLPLGKFML